jgi:flagellar motor protein MotB
MLITIILLLILVSCHAGCRTSSNSRIRLFSAPTKTQVDSQSPVPVAIPSPTPPTSPTSTSSVLSDKFRVNATNLSDNSPPFFSGTESISNVVSTTQPAINVVTDPSIIDAKRYDAFRPIIPNHFATETIQKVETTTTNKIPDKIPDKIQDKIPDKIPDKSKSISDSVPKESVANETIELKKQIANLETELKKAKELPSPIMSNYSPDKSKDQLPEAVVSSAIADSVKVESAKVESVKVESASQEKHLPLPCFNVEGITTSKDKEDAVRISIVDSLLFMNTSWKLTPDAEELLRRITTEIQAAYSDVEIDIEGHTDNLDIDPKNLTQKHDISAIKAGVVMDYCVKTLKCNPSKMKIIPYGSKRPIEDNSTPKGRAKNNRIEIVIIQPK